MEIPCEKQMKSRPPIRSEARSLEHGPTEDWVVENIKKEPVENIKEEPVENIKEEPVEKELVSVKQELDEPGTETKNERLKATFPQRVYSIDRERFVAAGVAAESLWPDVIDVCEVKLEPADESDGSYANATSYESSSELSDFHDAERQGTTLNASIETGGMPPGPRGKQLEVNQQNNERVRRAVRVKKVSKVGTLRQVPHSTKPIGRSPKTEEARKQYRCEECDIEYKTKLSLDIHTTLHHRYNLPAEPLHACTDCDNTYAHAQLLKRHMVSHKRKTCPQCGAKVACNNFKAHLATHDSNHPRYQCELCSRSYKTARYLKEHIAVKHAPQDRNGEKYVCGECDGEFANRIQFKIHRRNHRLSSRVCCEFCFKSYSRKWLSVHIATEHAAAADVSQRR